MGKLSNILMSRDRLGHPISVNYKGEDTHKTKIGALLSIGIQVMVIIFLIQRTIALVEMSDPTIVNQTRPIYEAEAEEFGQLELEDYHFNFGVFFTDRHGDPLEIPPEVGRVIQDRRARGERDVESNISAAIRCTEVFQEVNQKLTDESEIAKQAGWCHHPDGGHIEGVETFGGQVTAVLTFQPCRENPDIDQSLCYDKN